MSCQNRIFTQVSPFLFATLGLLFTFNAMAQTPPAQTKTEPTTTVETKPEAATPEQKTTPKPETKNDTEDSHQYGFQLSGGFPTGLGFGFNYHDSSKLWGAGVEYSSFSLKQGTAPEIKASLSQIKLVARYHPWAGAFFAGVHLGAQTTTFEGTDVYLGQQLTAKFEIKNNFVTPHIGWQWIFSSGFMYGLELGAQINTGAKTDFTDPTTNAAILNDASYQADKKKVEDEGKKFGSSTIPHLVLFRFGYLF